MFKTLKGHSNEIFWCCWSPNAQLLASAGIGKSIMVWDMVTYSLARTLTGHHHNVSACEFSPDGAILASSSWDTRVILWDPYTGIISTIILLLHDSVKLEFFSFFKRRRIKGIVPSVSATEAHFRLWCQWIVGERRGLRSQWRTNGHHLG